MVDADGGRCPVCRAAFRGTRECSRCGADLAPLMALTAEAFRCRQAARRALLHADFRRAAELAQRAESLRGTPQGRRLRALAAWLARGTGWVRRSSP